MYVVVWFFLELQINIIVLPRTLPTKILDSTFASHHEIPKTNNHASLSTIFMNLCRSSYWRERQREFKKKKKNGELQYFTIMVITLVFFIYWPTKTKPYNATLFKNILLNFGYKTHLSILLWILLVIIIDSFIHLIAVTALSEIFNYWRIVPGLSSVEPCKEAAYKSYITCNCSYDHYSSCHITSLYVPLFYVYVL